MIRSLLASALSLLAALLYVLGIRHEWYIAALPIALLVAAAVMAHRPSLGAQVFARGMWWSNLAFGLVVSATSSGRDARYFGALAIVAGAALLVSGRKPLAEASATAGYLPAALKSALMLLMVLALADAQTFLFFGTAEFIDQNDKLGVPPVMVAIGVGYSIGFFGLYRLQVWGALLNAGLSAVVLLLLYAFSLVRAEEPRTFLAILAVLHFVVAAPVGLAALSGTKLPTLPARARGLGADAIVGALMAWAAWLVVAHS